MSVISSLMIIFPLNPIGFDYGLMMGYLNLMNPKILLIKIYEPSVAEREGFIG